jgi:L-alanine-DL-glutamate epimerase-like enolase superfamily enzyme
MKLAHAAESLGIDIEFHGANPAIRQCMASVRNTNYYEMGLVHPSAPISHAPDLYLDYDDSLEAVDSNGHIPVPKGPGIGVEINWDWVNANRTNLIVYE